MCVWAVGICKPACQPVTCKPVCVYFEGEKEENIVGIDVLRQLSATHQDSGHLIRDRPFLAISRALMLSSHVREFFICWAIW